MIKAPWRRRRGRPAAGVAYVPLVLAAVLAVAGPVLGEEAPVTDPLLEESIREALDASPDNHLGAVVEVLTEPECRPEKETVLCRVTARVTELVGGRHEGAHWPPSRSEVRLVSGNTAADPDNPLVGQTWLVLAVPRSGDADTWETAVLIIGPDEPDVADFRAAYGNATGS